MKILKVDSSVMVIKDNRVVSFLFGILLVVIGLMVMINPNFFSNKPPLSVAVIIVFFGTVSLVFNKTTTARLDKPSNKLLLHRKGVLVCKRIQEYPLDQVKEVEIQDVYRRRKQGSSIRYQLSFVMATGERIILNPGGGSSAITIMGIPTQKSQERTIGANMAAFLGVPFQERRALSVGEIMSTISTGFDAAARAAKKQEKNRTHRI